MITEPPLYFYRDDNPKQPIIVLRPTVVESTYTLPKSGVEVTLPLLYWLPLLRAYPIDGSIRPVYV